MLIISIVLLIIAIAILLYTILSFNKSSILKRFILIFLVLISTLSGYFTFPKHLQHPTAIANIQSTKKIKKKTQNKKNSSSKISSSSSSSGKGSSSSSVTNDTASSSSSKSVSSSSTVQTSVSAISIIQADFQNQVSVTESNNIFTIKPTNSDFITKIARIASHNQESYNFNETKEILLNVSSKYPDHTIRLIDATTNTEIYVVKNNQITLDKIY